MKDNIVRPPRLGHVVKDYNIGHTHIRICDDYCRDKTPEDVRDILDRITERSLPYLLRAMKCGKITSVYKS